MRIKASSSCCGPGSCRVCTTSADGRTGLVGACGSFLLTQGYRLAEANVVAPFEYIAILLGALFGWWIWGEVPSAAT